MFQGRVLAVAGHCDWGKKVVSKLADAGIADDYTDRPYEVFADDATAVLLIGHGWGGDNDYGLGARGEKARLLWSKVEPGVISPRLVFFGSCNGWYAAQDCYQRMGERGVVSYAAQDWDEKEGFVEFSYGEEIEALAWNIANRATFLAPGAPQHELLDLYLNAAREIPFHITGGYGHSFITAPTFRQETES